MLNKYFKEINWTLYKCNICMTWLYGENGNTFQILLNNLYDYNKEFDKKRYFLTSSQLKDIKISKHLN
jgi:hypothetical protein